MDFLCFYFPLFCIHWLMVNNTRRNHWEEWEESACLARAGAALLGKGQQLFIVGGELKPGIRTAEISRITIK